MKPLTSDPLNMVSNCLCGHPFGAHDVEEYSGDGSEMCCVQGCSQWGCPGRTPAEEIAEKILVDHQRHRGGCLCGWAQLGGSHPAHQVDMMRAAGVWIPRRATTSPLGDKND